MFWQTQENAYIKGDENGIYFKGFNELSRGSQEKI